MNYYNLTNSLDTQVIGKYPQSILPKSIGNIRDIGEADGIVEIIVPEPVIHNEAKATTYLKINHINSQKFLVLHQGFIDFIKDFNIEEHQSWNIKVHHGKNILYDYNLFHLSNTSQEKFVRYEKSLFSIGKLGDWREKNMRKPIKIDTYNKYMSMVEVLRESKNKSRLRCSKLVLDLSQVNVDLFRLANMPSFGGGYFISERLKKAIEVNSFTGMAFKEISEIDKRIEVIY
ncbi:MAG: double-CXXCG motif protein [Bacteroidia bacterium]|nr:double-CXXCG motif protein [Bacteroidia bacterium]NND10059.1 hypothetical protein [Flavobacteriaceae bacterium]NNE13624.1 hypothetical protein [Saprospiraceae bacterium]MBT8304690.1 double-CXXCG motif protein [Bacteroidia bacterium]MBT8309646.1 double-CXXCG motif protein [Bacteroidia bacterium]